VVSKCISSSVDVNQFAQFIRATKVPPRDPALVGKAPTIAGEQIFHKIGCDGCHIPAIVTAPAGTVLNGGFFTVSDALGNKTIHPLDLFCPDVDSRGIRSKYRQLYLALFAFLGHVDLL
jgi:hypothetical protein